MNSRDCSIGVAASRTPSERVTFMNRPATFAPTAYRTLRSLVAAWHGELSNHAIPDPHPALRATFSRREKGNASPAMIRMPIENRHRAIKLLGDNQAHQHVRQRQRSE